MDTTSWPPSKKGSFPFVVAVIVNWNGRSNLVECLESLGRLNYPEERFQALVVDNGSTDGSQAVVSRDYQQVTILENQDNLGYVQAANKGIEYALAKGADYVWILNNDIVVREDSLERLVEAGETQEGIGVIGPVVYAYYNPDRIDNCGYRIDFWTGRLNKLKHGVDIFRDQNRALEDVESNMGCSNLVKSEVFRKVGQFNPIYEIYFEETDFNVRARKHGFRVVVVREAGVLHKVAATMNKFIFRRAYLLLRNLFLFQMRNAGFRHMLVFIPYYFLIHIPYFFIYGSVYGIKVRFKRQPGIDNG